MEILHPLFHYSAGNAAMLVLLRDLGMLNHLREFLSKNQPLSAEREMWNHRGSEQNQEHLLMSETAVRDEEGRKVFREP